MHRTPSIPFPGGRGIIYISALLICLIRHISILSRRSRRFTQTLDQETIRHTDLPGSFPQIPQTCPGRLRRPAQPRPETSRPSPNLPDESYIPGNQFVAVMQIYNVVVAVDRHWDTLASSIPCFRITAG